MFRSPNFIPVSRKSSTSKDTLSPYLRLFRLCPGLKYGLSSAGAGEGDPRYGDSRYGDPRNCDILFAFPIGVR